MPVEINGKLLYSPKEAAKKLEISVGMLRYLRNEGRIESTDLGSINYYTEEQLQNADTSPKKRGPNRQRKSKGEDAGGFSTSVILMSQTSRRLLEAAVC